MIYKIFAQLINTLTSYDKYYLLNKNNLTQPLQMKLSKKQKHFLTYFLHFKNLDQILGILKEKTTLKAYYSRNYNRWRTCLDKCLKGLVSQDLSTTNMVNRPKHSCNLHDSTFIIFYWSLRSKMCWKKSLLVIYNILGQLVNMSTTDDKYYLLKGDNLTEPIQMQLSKIKVFSNVLKSRSNFQHFEKKDDPQSLCTSAVADCKTRG